MTTARSVATRRFIAAHRRHPVLQALARGARSFVEAHENGDADLRANGEAWLLARLSEVRPSVVVDVGAGVGDWCAAARAAAEEALVHAVEPVPSAAVRLRDRFRDDPLVRVVEVGLADEAGSTKVRTDPAGAHDVGPEWLDVPLQRGDDFCADAGIEHIDLLKVGTGGPDHQVLRGFSRMFDAGAVTAVQFAYGHSSIHSRFLLRDFHELLEGHDMAVGKLYPTYVDFRAYDPRRHEDFIGPHFVAVRRARADLTRLLGPPGARFSR